MMRVLLAEDHSLVRSGVKLLLEQTREFEVVGEAADGREAVAQAQTLRPDVVVMDVGMPRLNGIEAARQIRKNSPRTKVIMLSMHNHAEYVRESLRAGAAGYVPKNSASTELIAALRAAMMGRTYIPPAFLEAMRTETLQGGGDGGSALSQLTAREREVLQLIAEGNTGPEIARQLGIGERTVETHRQNVMAKLNIRSVAGLTRFALRHGISPADR